MIRVLQSHCSRHSNSPRLTSTGKATHAAISPDGNYVVHVVNDSGKQSLWVRQVATSSNVQIGSTGCR